MPRVREGIDPGNRVCKHSSPSAAATDRTPIALTAPKDSLQRRAREIRAAGSPREQVRRARHVVLGSIIGS
jgi:hypothetical protein